MNTIVTEAEAALTGAETARVAALAQYDEVSGCVDQIRLAQSAHDENKPRPQRATTENLAARIAADPTLAASTDWAKNLTTPDLPKRLADWKAQGQVLADALEQLEGEQADAAGYLVEATNAIDDAFAEFASILQVHLAERFAWEIKTVWHRYWQPYLQIKSAIRPFSRLTVQLGGVGRIMIDTENSKIRVSRMGNPAETQAWPQRVSREHTDLSNLRQAVRDGVYDG